MKVWLNIYDKPPTFKNNPAVAANTAFVMHGFYPGTGFFSTEKMARASLVSSAVKQQMGVEGYKFLQCVEIEIPDELAPNG